MRKFEPVEFSLDAIKRTPRWAWLTCVGLESLETIEQAKANYALVRSALANTEDLTLGEWYLLLDLRGVMLFAFNLSSVAVPFDKRPLEKYRAEVELKRMKNCCADMTGASEETMAEIIVKRCAACRKRAKILGLNPAPDEIREYLGVS